MKRFQSATYRHADNTLVDVGLFTTRLSGIPDSGPGGNLWELSAGAQTQFMQILDTRFPETGSFLEALGRDYLGGSTYHTADLTEKNLRLVFSVSKHRDFERINDHSGRFSPADRIEYLSISLTLPEDSPLQFTQWNRFSTEYGEIDIADITFSRSFVLDAEAPLSDGDVNPRATLGRNESQEIRSRYLKLNGNMGDGWIRIEAEGTREADLTGNILADLTLRFKAFPERITIPLFEPAGPDMTRGTGLAGLSFAHVLVPRMEEAPERIVATLSASYIYRHVQAGWKTFQEWDDRVEYYSGSLEKEVTLFTREDYLPEFYCIGSEQDEKKVMTLRHSGGKEYPLQFASFQEAGRFLEWLTGCSGTEPLTVGAYALLFDGIPIMPAMINGTDGIRVLPVY